MYEVQFYTNDSSFPDSLFFDELDEAMKYAKLKELEQAVIIVNVFKVLYVYDDELGGE